MSNSHVNLVESIASLTALTRDDQIRWHRVAPTVYAATRETKGAEKALVIQGLSEVRSPSGRLVRQAGYLFQVGLRRTDIDPELVIDTRERPDLEDALRRLYEAAGVSADAQAADVLRELIA